MEVEHQPSSPFERKVFLSVLPVRKEGSHYLSFLFKIKGNITHMLHSKVRKGNITHPPCLKDRASLPAQPILKEGQPCPSSPFKRKVNISRPPHLKGRVVSLVYPIRNEGQHRPASPLERKGNTTRPLRSKGRHGNLTRLHPFQRKDSLKGRVALHVDTI